MMHRLTSRHLVLAFWLVTPMVQATCYQDDEMDCPGETTFCHEFKCTPVDPYDEDSDLTCPSFAFQKVVYDNKFPYVHEHWYEYDGDGDDIDDASSPVACGYQTLCNEGEICRAEYSYRCIDVGPDFGQWSVLGDVATGSCPTECEVTGYNCPGDSYGY